MNGLGAAFVCSQALALNPPQISFFWFKGLAITQISQTWMMGKITGNFYLSKVGIVSCRVFLQSLTISQQEQVGCTGDPSIARR